MKQAISEDEYKAFLTSAGGWADVDTEQFLKDNRESLDRASRPPVNLDDAAVMQDVLEAQQAIRAEERKAFFDQMRALAERADLSPEEAMHLALEAQQAVRAEKRTRNDGIDKE